MRIRSIKPEFWRSEDIAALPIPDRLLFIGLWSYVDDNGVGPDRESLIAADLFADDLSRDPRDTLARISEGLRRLSDSGLITRYTVENRRYIAVTTWGQHQRIDKPNKPRYPLPTSENAEFATPSRHSRENPAPGTEEQGNRGTGEQVVKDLDQTSGSIERNRVHRFDEFWSACPRKVGKDKARSAYTAAVKRAGDEQTVIDGMRRFAADPNLPEKQFIPHPTTWLTRGGWGDEPLPPRNGPQNAGKSPSGPPRAETARPGDLLGILRQHRQQPIHAEATILDTPQELTA